MSHTATDEQVATAVDRLDVIDGTDLGEVVEIVASILPSEVNEAILRAMKRRPVREPRP